jgi:amino acid adenylation domain-containing protein
MNKNSNLIQLLQERAKRQPLQLAYTFLTDGETEEVNLTYEQIDRRARAIAAWLQALRAEGERVLLLYPPGIEYISAFWGCLYAGAIAVPAYPPRQNRSLLRLQAVAADAQATTALTNSSLLAKVDAMTAECGELKSLRWLATDTIPDGLASQWRTPSLSGESLAFLQYTSGSTSTPKGVMVTHRNLLHNERMIQEAFSQTEQSVIVGWLPLYHDMGLIGNVLQPVYVGARCVLMSPVAFLQNPFRWLSAISRYRATTSGGPNFAYDLCVRKIDSERRELLDLSSWEVAFNGAEPVRAETLESFAEAFAPYGFRRQAFRPCYGLAEATLLVAGEGVPQQTPLVKSVEAEALQGNLLSEVREGGEGVRSLVGCGRVASGQKVYIYHPETLAECLPGQVGEICVSGENVAKGYWNRPDETRRVFQSHVRDGRTETLLRTGDLGCLSDGDLFVTGRIKDLIIIRGRNHYPHDIERTVEQSHTALRPGSGAAFVVEVDGEERLVVAQEVSVRRQLRGEEIVRAITEAVAAEHEVQVHAVVLLKTGSIPKTSSGKIQRHACREKFLSKGFDALTQWESGPAPQSAGDAPGAKPDVRSVEAIEAWLRLEFAAKLGIEASAVDIDRPVSDYALDSLAAIELAHRIEAALGVSLSMTSFLAGSSIAEIARQTQVAHAATVETPTAPQIRAASPFGFPLSHGQRALWFLHQLAPDSAAYNVATVVRVTSGLDVPALRRAFQSLLDRHACLRTTFGVHQDEPVQHVFDYAEVCFQEADASAWSEAELDGRLVEESNRRFDLEQGPLMRVSLFARSEEEHVILLVIHHIVTDFWSLVTLTNELGVLYQAEVSGVPAQLPANPFQYSGFVRQQEEMLAGPRGEKLWAYWRQQLDGELPVLDLPVDRPRPVVQTYNGSSETFKLDEELTRGLKNLSREHGATLYMTLLAAFQTLLYRYTGQKDILVGSPTLGRSQSELASATGYFVNPVVLRASLSGSSTFASFLAQTKQTVLAAFEHQDYPFPLLVERLQPEREASRSPLFQAMFILQKAPLTDEKGIALFALGEAGARMKLGALELESTALAQRISQFDLTLVMAEAGETLSASLQYNTDLFEAQTIRRMCEHLKTLLRGIVAAPRQQLSGLPLLTEAERHQLLYDWNETGARPPADACVHQLFEAQAARTPHSPALVCPDASLTYAQLDSRADGLARRLRALGAGPEVFVAVLMRRRAGLAVALLAVLKAGAAYLPLDPDYPRERLRFMLEDTAAPLLLTERDLLDMAGGLCDGRDGTAETRLVCAEDDGELVGAAEPAAGAACAAVAAHNAAAVTPRNAAYVIYTSGSTGRPKGVVIEHSSASAMLSWAVDFFGPRKLEAVLFSTSVCFDLSVFELFAPLSVGGAAVMADTALELPRLAAASRLTLLNTVPSAMAELVHGGRLPAGVRTVNLAGEALTRELAEAVYAAGEVEEVVNLYGPSEDTTYSTYAVVARGGEGAPEIGRPLPGTRLYVLDGCGQPVAAGVTGELYIGGVGLGRGYLRRAGLTAERFTPDPFSGEAGARLYRTGDLVRYAEGGAVEYVGRVDHQVKLRGYRIEMGEVEAAVRSHSLVRECVAQVEGEGEGRRLVCYVVMEGGQEVDGQEAGRQGVVEEEAGGKEAGEQEGVLREWVRGRLPEYMVPQGFVCLGGMPLTANGKVDRKALSAEWALAAARSTAVGREPAAGLEAEVAGVWCEVLGREWVGAREDFFEAGGHSLLATRVVSQVRRRFGVEVGLRDFFEEATVEGLARLIQHAHQSSAESKPPVIVRASREQYHLNITRQGKPMLPDALRKETTQE